MLMLAMDTEAEMVMTVPMTIGMIVENHWQLFHEL